MKNEAIDVRDASAGYPLQVDMAVVPEGYKQTEVGVIPEDWRAVQIGDLFDFKNGLNKEKRFFGHGTPIVNYMDVFGRPGLRCRDVKGRVTLSKEEIDRFDVKKGDVFFTRTSETIDEIGTACVMLENAKDTVFSGFVLRARPVTSRVLDAFNQYCFQNQSVRRQIVATATYTTRALTNGRVLSQVLVPLPSKEEQLAIATTLSDVDALLEALDRLIAKKRDIKQAAMQQLLTGQTRLPGFEGKWETVRLGDHVVFLRHGVNSRAELLDDGSVRYLHYGDIHATSSARMNPSSLPFLPTTKAKALARLQNGDVIFADASEDMDGVGKSVELVDVGQIELVAGLHTIAARFDKAVLSDGFKAYLQFCPEFITALRRLAAGTKVYATTRSHIAGVAIRLPKVEEQRAIAAVFSDMDAEIEALEQRRSKTAALKRAMIQELLTGRTRLVEPTLEGAR